MSEETAPTPERLAKWVRRLRHPEAERRVYAAMALTAPGLDLAPVMPALREALMDSDAEVRRLATWVLGRVGQQRDAA